jgi:hypothetical protein
MPQGAVEGIVWGLETTTGIWRRLPGAAIYINDVKVATSKNDPTGQNPQIVGAYCFPKPGNFQVNSMYCTKPNWIKWVYPGVPFLIPPLVTVSIVIRGLVH